MRPFGIIYLVTNTVNGKQYVGQTVQLLKERLASHLLDANRGSAYLLHRAIRKYGYSSFTVEEIDVAQSRKELNAKETFNVLLYNTLAPNGYNLTLGGAGISGLKHSIETKRKMSEAQRGQWLSDEHRQKTV